MRSRGLVVAIAVVLAVAAAAAVILYTNGVKQNAEEGGSLTTVIVSGQDIPANTQLNPLIEQGVFDELSVPTNSVVDGAVTSTDALKGQTTTAPVLANEQIPEARLSSGEAPEGGTLGIEEGHVALSISLESPAGGAGNVGVGDNVVVYATYNGVKIVGDVKQILKGQVPTSGGGTLPDFTATLVPETHVLRIQNPTVSTEGRTEDGEVLLTLDLSKEDAQNVVFAMENARVYIGLLPPGEHGEQLKAATVPAEVLLKAVRLG